MSQPQNFSLIVNGDTHTVSLEPDTPLLWVLRDHLGLTGTRFGCGAGLCGACTVHLDGDAVRSCQLLIEDVAGANVTTIEGLAEAGFEFVQAAWAETHVPQCGYCQSGQQMSAAALLRETPDPADEDIDAAMDGNICRCGTYPRIRKAIKRAAQSGRDVNH